VDAGDEATGLGSPPLAASISFSTVSTAWSFAALLAARKEAGHLFAGVFSSFPPSFATLSADFRPKIGLAGAALD